MLADIDLETNRRCALAALAVLADEVLIADCSPAMAQRLRLLAEMARDHVAAPLAENSHRAPLPQQAARPGGSAVVIPFPVGRR